MHHLKSKISIILSLVALYSCAPIMHVNNVMNVPNLSEKGNCNINSYIGLNHLETQVAFSPLKNMGVMVNSYLNLPNNSASGTNNVDIALGTYRLYKNNVYFDTYFGYSIGNRKFHDESRNNRFDKEDGYHIFNFSTQYNRQFIQASIFNKREKITISAACQFGNIHYNAFKGVYLDYRRYQNKFILSQQELINSLEKQNLKYIHLAISLKMGVECVSLILQPFYYQTLYDLSDFNKAIIYMNKQPYGLNIGLNFFIH